MRRALVLLGCVIAGCGGTGQRARGTLEVTRGSAGMRGITLVVDNGTNRPQTVAQVAVDDGFVPLPGPPRTIAPHTTARVAVPYPIVAGESYRVAVLTATGQKLEYRID